MKRFQRQLVDVLVMPFFVLVAGGIGLLVFVFIFIQSLFVLYILGGYKEVGK